MGLNMCTYVYMCVSLCRSAMVSSQLEAFLESMAGECDEKALHAIKAKDVFYAVCLTKIGIWFVIFSLAYNYSIFSTMCMIIVVSWFLQCMGFVPCKGCMYL